MMREGGEARSPNRHSGCSLCGLPVLAIQNWVMISESNWDNNILGHDMILTSFNICSVFIYLYGTLPSILFLLLVRGGNITRDLYLFSFLTIYCNLSRNSYRSFFFLSGDLVP